MVSILRFPAQIVFRNNFSLSLHRLSCLLGSSTYAYLENACVKFSVPKFATITCLAPQEQCLCSRSVTLALPNYSLQGCASEDLKKGESNTCAEPQESVTVPAIKLCFLEFLIPFRHMNKSEETDLRFAVFITFTAEQGEEEKTNPNQKSQRPQAEFFLI